MGRRNESSGDRRTTSHRSRNDDRRVEENDSGSGRRRHHRHHHRRDDRSDDDDNNNNSQRSNTRADLSSSSSRRHRHQHHHHHHRSSGNSNTNDTNRDDKHNSSRRRRGSDSDQDDREAYLSDRDDNGSRSRGRHQRRGDRGQDREARESHSRHRRQRRERRDDDDDNQNYGRDDFSDASNGYTSSHSNEGRQRGRKRNRGGDRDDDADEGGSANGRHDNRLSMNNRRGDRSQNAGDDNRVNSSLENRINAPQVDWSSRRGRRQMPSLAYDVNQQKRFLGFMDRRDASGRHGDGGQAAAAEMTFEIGPDGLVQMPPPNTLVRQGRHQRRGEERNTHKAAPPTYQGNSASVANDAPAKVKEDEDDDDDSVASHESLYHDPATAHLGILPDMLPPSNLYRVALYGVDLTITAEHLSSVVEQLLGKAAAPYRVRRPAREMLVAAMAYSNDTHQHNSSSSNNNRDGKDKNKGNDSSASVTAKPKERRAPVLESSATAGSDGGVLADAPGRAAQEPVLRDSPSRCSAQGGAVLADAASASSGILPDTPAVLGAETVVMDGEKMEVEEGGVLGGASSGVLGDDERATGAMAGDNNTAAADEGVLPDASSLPQPPQPAAPAFYLPGLHDVSGPGGMVVLEFASHEHAFRTVQMLNGGYVNGRRIAASM